MAKCEARKLVVEWLEDKSQALWPRAVRGQTFDWDLLFHPASDASAEQQLDFQVIKANIDPWACCAGSPAGSTRWRLRADGSGFAHLYLAGAWIDSGFNVECIESAVISGRQAARAITGKSVEFDGENFLHNRRGSGGLICALERGAVAAAQVLGLALTAARPESAASAGARHGAARRQKNKGRHPRRRHGRADDRVRNNGARS